MTLELLIALLAGDTVIAGILSSVVTWLLTKRKYNSEVDNSNIHNMHESLDFYVTLANDYKNRLEQEIQSHNKEVAELKEENITLKREMREQEKRYDDKITALQKEITLMKNQMLSVYSQVCLNFNCAERIATQHIKVEAPKVKKARTIKKEDKDGEKI